MVFADRRPDKWTTSRLASDLGLGRSRSNRSRHQLPSTPQCGAADRGAEPVTRRLSPEAGATPVLSVPACPNRCFLDGCALVRRAHARGHAVAEMMPDGIGQPAAGEWAVDVPPAALGLCAASHVDQRLDVESEPPRRRGRHFQPDGSTLSLRDVMGVTSPCVRTVQMVAMVAVQHATTRRGLAP